MADAYASKYEWSLTVRDGAFFAEYGAPSAGSPPYDPYEMTPVTGFGLGMVEPIRCHALEILDGVLSGHEP